MVGLEARGRLPGMEPISVIDIGSNSVRLVIYEGLNRVPTVLFNEKVLCGLGRGLAKNGRMRETAVERALAAIRRFKGLSKQARAVDIHILATAAVRESENGSEFVENAEKILNKKIMVISGKEEAFYSAEGIRSGFFEPEGLVGDMGGGSLELTYLVNGNIEKGTTLPLGGLRLLEGSENQLDEAQKLVTKAVEKVDFLHKAEGGAFYCVGGTWRNLAKLHMEYCAYPLHVMQGYEISYAPAVEFLEEVATGNFDKDRLKIVSKNRRALLPYGAIALLEVLKKAKPSKLVFSGLGLREGYLYSLLNASQREEDPLVSVAENLSILRARSPSHSRELAVWAGKVLATLDIEETTEEKRYRKAACLMADIAWRAHPDYRSEQALNFIAHGTFSGISHAGRAYIALANYYRFEGFRDNAAIRLLEPVAGQRYLRLAKMLGGIMRIAYMYSASMPGALEKVSILNDEDIPDGLVLRASKDMRELDGERIHNRLAQLAKLVGRPMRIDFN